MVYKTFDTETFKKYPPGKLVESITIVKHGTFIDIIKYWKIGNSRAGYHSLDMSIETAESLKNQLNALFEQGVTEERLEDDKK